MDAMGDVRGQQLKQHRGRVDVYAEEPVKARHMQLHRHDGAVHRTAPQQPLTEVLLRLQKQYRYQVQYSTVQYSTVVTRRAEQLREG